MAQEQLPFLNRIARRRPATERCELCSMELSHVHQHLLDPNTRQIVCSCDGCAVLFCGQAGAHYLRVPRRIRSLPDFQMADLQWESLMIPINLAFFYRSSPAQRVIAMFPSPAGATESLLTLEAWHDLAKENPILAEMEPDVEALLVYRIGEAHEYFIVPIDECFKLVGLIRTHWRGLSGGTEVWRELAKFFTGLKSRETHA